MTKKAPRIFRFSDFVIPSSFVISASSFSRRTRIGCRKSRIASFTLIELIVVIGIIIVLASLVLATSGYVTKKGQRSRAEAEIAALSAALESYKADNGIYPREENGSTDLLNAKIGINSSNYSTASLYLFTQLNGTNASFQPTTGAKSYFNFKPQMLAGARDSNGNIISVSYIRDPFGNSYGYSTAYQHDPTTGYNPTYDLWSNADPTPTPSVTPTPTPQDRWIKNW